MKPLEDLRAGRGPHALGAEQVLDAERRAFQRPGLALGAAGVGGPRPSRSALSGVSTTKAFSGRAASTAVDMRLGDLARRRSDLSARPSRAAFSVSPVRSGHHSTTFGTTKKPSIGLRRIDQHLRRVAAVGDHVLAQRQLSWPPTWSSARRRRCRPRSAARSSARMPLSSRASGSSLSSGSAMRASLATLRTVAASMAMTIPPLFEGRGLAARGAL